MIVMKFGGTSVEDKRAIERVTEIVRSRIQERPVVVVSAMAGVTDDLLAMSHDAACGRIEEALHRLEKMRCRHMSVLHDLVGSAANPAAHDGVHALLESLQGLLRGVSALGELTPRTTDHILGMGELLSSRIICAAFALARIPCALVDSRKCIVTDECHNNAAPHFDLTSERLGLKVAPLLSDGCVPVMGGFIGATTDGIMTTLGRGGSDYSAAIIGASLDAERIEIWTDVEGMMTTDPRLYPRAHRIDVITFDEASELAYFGAKVLHPATLVPAIEKNIPVYVLSSRNPQSRGTCVRSHAPRSRTTFRAIAAKKNMTVVNIKSRRRLKAHGFLRAVFETFERHACAADLVSTSEISVSVALDSSRPIDPLLRELKSLGEVEVEDGKAIICLVGKDIRGQAGIAASVFDTIAAANINVHMISQGASEINIGFVIEERDVPEAIRHLHRHFFEEKSPPSHAMVQASSGRVQASPPQDAGQVEVG
jgi:aspartate kinase